MTKYELFQEGWKEKVVLFCKQIFTGIPPHPSVCVLLSCFQRWSWTDTRLKYLHCSLLQRTLLTRVVECRMWISQSCLQDSRVYTGDLTFTLFILHLNPLQIIKSKHTRSYTMETTIVLIWAARSAGFCADLGENLPTNTSNTGEALGKVPGPKGLVTCHALPGSRLLMSLLQQMHTRKGTESLRE